MHFLRGTIEPRSQGQVAGHARNMAPEMAWDFPPGWRRLRPTATMAKVRAGLRYLLRAVARCGSGRTTTVAKFRKASLEGLGFAHRVVAFGTAS